MLPVAHRWKLIQAFALPRLVGKDNERIEKKFIRAAAASPIRAANSPDWRRGKKTSLGEPHPSSATTQEWMVISLKQQTLNQDRVFLQNKILLPS